MKYWLVVFIFTGGHWVAGKDVKPTGWSPRAYASKAECMERRAYALKALKVYTRAPSKWFCTTNKTATLAELEKGGG